MICHLAMLTSRVDNWTFGPLGQIYNLAPPGSICNLFPLWVSSTRGNMEHEKKVIIILLSRNGSWWAVGRSFDGSICCTTWLFNLVRIVWITALGSGARSTRPRRVGDVRATTWPCRVLFSSRYSFILPVSVKPHDQPKESCLLY